MLGPVLVLVLLCAVAALLWERCAERERLVRAAHEVRGPLTALHLALHAAGRRGELPPTRLAALALELRRAGLALDDLHGPQRGGARPEPVDLGELLELQALTWGEVARAHGAELVLHPPAPGTVVHGDAVRLAQAVGNVLANAIEHGGGRIELRATVTADRARVDVTDSGRGLPAVVVGTGPRTGRGTRGRGLAIAAQVARRHGGRLASLPSSRGARLALELPAADGASA